MARPMLSVPVGENHGSTTVWEGVVHVFDLTGHPTATTAYAWSSRTEGSDTRRFFAVLHLPPITSPAEAVRAAIASLKRNIGRPSSATNAYDEVIDFVHRGDGIASPDVNAAHWHLALQNAMHLH